MSDGTVREEIAQAVARLKEAGIEGAARDARKLMGPILSVAPDRVSLHLGDEIDPGDITAYRHLVERRCSREPVSHLLGGRAFYGRWFEVTPGVLDPRPETETLIEAALAVPFSDLLDLGTGSGCILLSLLAEREDARGLGTDISDVALEVARRNARALGVEARCSLAKSDWFGEVTGQFDLIVSNPPYIAAQEMQILDPELAYEPRMALTDEGDGLSAYRVIAEQSGKYLRQGGRLMVEIGWKQGETVRQLFESAGFEEIVVARDLDGRARVVSGLLPR